MTEHADVLTALNRSLPLSAKLRAIHRQLNSQAPFIDRIAVATYDPKTDLVKTFIHSSHDDNPLSNYQARLSASDSLLQIVKTGTPRVTNDLSIYAQGTHEHTRRIAAQQYGASYTLPMFANNIFFGFVFFNSYGKDVFVPTVLPTLDVFGHLIGSLITNELTLIKTLLSTIKTARDMTNERDPETGAHLDRMSRFARLIAKELAVQFHFDDEYIEHVFLFAPLHDIGKIGVPDRILLKPGKLDAEEYAEMKTHAIKGRQIIDTLLLNYGLGSFQYIEVLRNIAEYHHEHFDGNGYPEGLKGDSIPIEARIIAVADVFDALTSRRPYKEAWSNDEAFAALERLSGHHLDPLCVHALVNNRARVEQIQQRFIEANSVSNSTPN
jgi:HD-GYP domain-containing protein (c-di-GMP phosphodiesterase class II)